jgi:hypothetical protein
MSKVTPKECAVMIQMRKQVDEGLFGRDDSECKGSGKERTTCFRDNGVSTEPSVGNHLTSSLQLSRILTRSETASAPCLSLRF